MKWLLFKLAFLYPVVYAFFCYYRKERRRREIQDKFIFFLGERWNPKRGKEIVKHIFELRGSRKVMRYLIPHLDSWFIKKYVKVEGRHHLDRVVRAGRGVVLMAGHLGNFHLALNVLRTMGYDVTFLKGGKLRTSKHPRLKHYDRAENTVFVHDPSLPDSFKKSRLLEILKSGGILYYDADAAEGRRKERVSFLGNEMDFPTGMIHLARRAGAAIIPFIHLYRRGRMTLIFKEPIDHQWGDEDGSYRRIIREFSSILESYLLEHPEQFLGIYGPTVVAECYRSSQLAISPDSKGG